MSVEFRYIGNFETLPLEEAERIIYEELVPLLESKKIKLSSYGNHNSEQTLSSIREYNNLKAQRKLFDIPRIQLVCRDFQEMMQIYRRYTGQTSYGLKHDIERYQHLYISNGDCIVAMIVNGLRARFKRIDNKLPVNCMFKAGVKV